jgi:4-diphosphocytidyl-2-C-methyl-D-erythritol kinase
LSTASLSARIILTIKKNIWIAAGLGGGSSDAAQVLMALNRHFEALRPLELFNLAAHLGADVPFFLDPQPMRARGRGDQLTPLVGFPKLVVVLVNPGLSLSTAQVFQALDLNRCEKNKKNGLLEHVPHIWEEAEMSSLIWNDLKEPAMRFVPQIPAMEQALKANGAFATGMTGSGPTVFGLFRYGCEALQAETALKGGFCQSTRLPKSAGSQHLVFSSIVTQTLVP